MRLGLFLAFCCKYSVGLAPSATNNTAEGAATDVEWAPAAAVVGYWCAALLVLTLATCAARGRRSDTDTDADSDARAAADAEHGLCDRLAHCWPWAPRVADSPLASQIHLGRARYSLDPHSLRYEQLVENKYVFFRAVPLDILWEGRGDEITEKTSLAEDYDQKLAKTDDGEHEVLAIDGHEELAGHGHEELADRGHEELSSRVYEEPESREHEKLASDAHEELASHGHEELASDGNEELARREDEALAFHEHEELASRRHEKLESNELEKLVSNGHEKMVRNGHAELAGVEPELLVSSVLEEAMERVWAAPTRRKLRLQEVSSEPLPARESGDWPHILQDSVIPADVKPEASSPSHMSETETPPPFGTTEDRQFSAYASKQQSVTFSDKLRHVTKRGADEGGSSRRTGAAGKAADRTPPCPLHSPGGPLSPRPSVKSLPSTRAGDLLDQEIEYSDKLCTCPPSKKESPRLVGVGSGSNQPVPATEDELKRQVEVVRILSRYSSFVPDDEKDAVPKDPLTIPKAWVPIQEQAAYARTTASADRPRLAETSSEIAPRESRTPPPERRRRGAEQVSNRRGVGVEQVASRRGEVQFMRDEERFMRGEGQFMRGDDQFKRGEEEFMRRDEQFTTDDEEFMTDDERYMRGGDQYIRGEEQFISRRGIKRSRNEADDGYVTPELYWQAQSKSREADLDSSHRRHISRSVAAQTSPLPSTPTRRIAFAEVGTQVLHPEVHSVILGSDSMEGFAATSDKTQTPSMRSRSVILDEVVKGGSRVPSSCFMHDIVPSLQQRRKRSLLSIRTEETETPGVQYWEEPRYTIAPAVVSVANEDFLSSRKVNTTRHDGNRYDHSFAGEDESELSTQWDLLHNFPSSAVSSPAGDNEYVPRVTRNTSAFEEGVEVICKNRPHTVCSTLTEQVLPKATRSKFRPPAEASPESVELLYNRNAKHPFSDSVSATPTSEAEEFTVYLECQCPDAVRDYEQEKSFMADESIIYGLQPELDQPPTERSAGSWRATPDYQAASPTVMEPPAKHPMGQQRPTVAAHALTGDQKTMLHWKIVVRPEKGGGGEGSSDLLPERGPSQRRNQDATTRQK